MKAARGSPQTSGPICTITLWIAFIFPWKDVECWLIEPTETEAPDELDGFVEAMVKIQKEAEETPDLVKGAPYTQPVRRLDDVKAARELDLVWGK